MNDKSDVGAFFIGCILTFVVNLAIGIIVVGAVEKSTRMNVQEDACRYGVGEFVVGDDGLEFRWKEAAGD